MTMNEKNYLNIKCLWGILRFWVNCKNWHLAPRRTVDCFENTEAKVGRSCELYRAPLSMIVESMAHKRGTHGSAGT